jgi:O-antigen biosynthesis protein
MRLSVIIVSYNVRKLLEECLLSVERAIREIEAEIIVVDNKSEDNSAEMVAEKFPNVSLIRNQKNLGFSKANNQARTIAAGEYVLFLNPDTVVREDTFSVCLDFMDAHPKAGAMGVKMTDGRGKFLPESKRAVPTPMVAFYKLSGLTALFPRSKKFGRYYLGHLDKDKPHQIEILTGAFFFARKEALDKAGWFDEVFFMYGEDIDLSRRLLQNNYTIHYHPGTSIIHYKGESTRKGSINYVLIFYRAMAIYARKHFNSKGTFLLVFMLFIAIYFRAGLSISKRILNRLALPLLDIAVIFTGTILIPPAWQDIIAKAGEEYPSENQTILIPAFVLIWILSIYFSGGYKDPLKIGKALRGVIYGGLIILIMYGMISQMWYLKLMTIIPMVVYAIAGITLTRIIFKSLRDKQA